LPVDAECLVVELLLRCTTNNGLPERLYVKESDSIESDDVKRLVFLTNAPREKKRLRILGKVRKPIFTRIRPCGDCVN
jgi:hypothetical protein